MFNYLMFLVMPILVWFFFSLIYKKTINSSDKLKRKYLIICGIFLFFMIACRHYSVGSGDGEWYYKNWQYFGKLPFNNFFNVIDKFDLEKGYLVCVWVLSHIFEEPQFLFVFYGLLVSVAVCYFLDKNCTDVVMGFEMFVCLGLWGFMVQGLRQGIAMSICLFAIEYCKKRKPVPFVFLVLLATTFHATAMVFIIVYLFNFFQMNIKNYLSVGVCTIIACILINNIFVLVNNVINDSYEIGNIERTSGGVVSALIYILILVAMLLLCGKSEENKKNIAFFFYMTWCGFITFMMRYSVNTISQRISYYFMFGQMITLPFAVKQIKGKERLLVSMLIVILCLGIAIYKSSYSELIPYTFFWQE